MTTEVDNKTVRAIGDRKSNAALIADCHRLGYLKADDLVADVTYGLGRFWSDWAPDALLASDLDPLKSPCGLSVDFTDLPFETDELDAVVLIRRTSLVGRRRSRLMPVTGSAPTCRPMTVWNSFLLASLRLPGSPGLAAKCL